MTTLRPLCVLLTIVLGLLSLPAAAATTPSQTVDAFHTALRTNKPDSAMALLGREAVIFEQGFISSSPKEYQQTALADAVSFATQTERTVIRRESWQDGDMAWVTSSTMTRGVFQGRRLNLEGAETMILRKDGDGWKISHIHWSAHPVEDNAQSAP